MEMRHPARSRVHSRHAERPKGRAISLQICQPRCLFHLPHIRGWPLLLQMLFVRNERAGPFASPGIKQRAFRTSSLRGFTLGVTPRILTSLGFLGFIERLYWHWGCPQCPRFQDCRPSCCCRWSPWFRHMLQFPFHYQKCRCSTGEWSLLCKSKLLSYS
jgi:hypothetical protein